MFDEPSDPLQYGVRQACEATRRIAEHVRERSALTHHVYSAVYAAGWRGRGDWKKFDTGRWGFFNAAFVDKLQREVNSCETSAGWSKSSVKGDVIFLARDGVDATAHISSIVEASFGLIDVRMPAVRPLTPGFVVLKRNERNALLTSRFYLSINPEHVAWLFGSVAQRIADARIPFEVKAASNPFAYWRQDAAVLYVPSEKEHEIVSIIDSCSTLIKGKMRLNSLLLTREVSRSIRTAHQPKDGSSHGQWVTSILVDAVERSESLDEIVDIFWSSVVASGRSRGTPWLVEGA